VRPGDTLSSIARHFDLSVDDLKRLNQLSSDRIGVGDKLTVRK
jgi:membrane-bound lytic murein transglycosylase D